MEQLILSGCLVINDKKEILLLFKKNHQHYETPGGKVENCKDSKNPTLKELKEEARRETFEELGEDIKISELEYFGNISFTIPDGRLAIANKFTTTILEGTPKNNEPENFDHIKWIPLSEIEKYPISPDLKKLILKLKEILL
jgi:8-oxo-dGTP pyrophosphatase MutT (NUDIX family)